MIKKYENFTGKIKLDTQEVIDLINILFELKPTIPDEFPDKSVSKLASNTVTYKSDDDIFNIAINFQENDLYIDRYGNITTGKYRTIFKVKISKEDSLNISEVKDYIRFTSDIILQSYEDVTVKILIDSEKYNLEDFIKMGDRTISDIIFIIKIV